MSIGGLLASALGGAAQSGAAMADKIGTEKRENKKQAGLLSDKNNREDEIRIEQNKIAKDAADLAWNRQQQRDKTLHSQNVVLASIKNRGISSSKIDPRIKQRVDVITDLMGSDNITPEQYDSYSTELNSLTRLDGVANPSITTNDAASRLNSLATTTTVPGGAQKEPKEVPKWKQLQQQENAAKAEQEVANKAAIDAESKQIGSTLQANNPVANEAPSETERKRSEAEAIINKVKSGGRILSHELNLLRRYNVPAEILEEASRHLADYSDEEIISALPKIDPHKFAGMTPDEVKFVATNDEWQITKGFKAGIDQTQALGGGLVAAVGDAIGAEGLKQEGLDIYESNMSEAGLRSGNVAGFTDIEGIEDTLDWASYTLGNLVPSVATVVGTGGIGGAVAKIGGKKLVNNLVEKELGKGVSLEIAKQTAGKELAKRIATGTAAGSYAGGVGLGTGSVYGDTGDAGISLIHGLFIGGLDALPILRAMGRSASGASREAAVSSVKAEMAKQGVYEGATEAAQNFVEQHARYMSENDGASLLGNLGETNVKELIDNAAAGALGGSAMGGGIGLARRNRQTPEEAQQTEETTQDNEFPTIDLRQPTEQAPSSGITEQEYYAALEVPFVSRNEEQDAIIFNFCASLRFLR